MKPVESVSIGGYVFSLEDDACAVVRNYITELDSFYSKEESGAEVMEGIEERMSELLLEKCGRGGVVTLPIVESVIAILGRPEAIEEESSDSREESKEANTKQASREEKSEKIRRKLYRDPSTAKLGGVCSGLGAYFGIDPTIFRLLFTILTLAGLGFIFHHGWIHVPNYIVPLMYLVLWLCMPEAKTVRQRDEMRGEKGTVDDISARVMSAANEMGETAGKVVHSDFWPGLWRVFEVCLGIIFLITGIAGVVALGCMAVDSSFMSNTFILNRVLEELANEAPRVLDMLSYPPLVAAMVVSVVLPFIGLIYAGVMLIFDLKAPKWHPGLWIFVIWLIAITVLAVVSTMMLVKGVI